MGLAFCVPALCPLGLKIKHRKTHGEMNCNKSRTVLFIKYFPTISTCYREILWA